MTQTEKIRAFDGGVAIVTGGASGIGRALAETLADRGCEVVLADLQADLAEEVATGIQERGSRATAVHLDVTDFPAVQGLVQETAKRCGRLDYMFNNAGILVAGEVQLHTIEDWNRLIDVNLRGVVNGIQATYPLFLDQGFGHIVNTASTAGLLPTPGQVGYAATKHAVVGLSKSLRAEASPAGIRVSAICPGPVRTPILQASNALETVPEGKWNEWWERLRPMDPGEFARAVLPQIARNKAIIVIGARYKIGWWIDRASPALAFSVTRRLYDSQKRLLRA